MIQNLCQKAGLLKRREIPIINSKEKIIGHGDGELSIPFNSYNGAYLLEFKTINPRDFAILKEPQLGHKQQSSAYMKCLNLPAAVILYYNKAASLFKEFVYAFEEKFYRKQVKDRIDWHFDNVRTNTLPPREGVNPRLMPCLYCEFTHVCFDNQRLDNFMKTLKPKPRLRVRLK